MGLGLGRMLLWMKTGCGLQVTAEVIYNTVQAVLYCCIVYFACGEVLQRHSAC